LDCLSAQSAWSAAEVERFLSRYVAPLRVAVQTESGFPLLCSLWFVYEDGALHCATQADAAVTRHLERSPRCAYELAPNEPPYFGVRGQGTVEISTDGAAPLLARLIERYLGTEETSLGRWLMSRADTEVRLSITPTRINAWDYRDRMSGSE
jgi:hypothetical protein